MSPDFFVWDLMEIVRGEVGERNSKNDGVGDSGKKWMRMRRRIMVIIVIAMMMITPNNPNIFG